MRTPPTAGRSRRRCARRCSASSRCPTCCRWVCHARAIISTALSTCITTASWSSRSMNSRKASASRRTTTASGRRSRCTGAASITPSTSGATTVAASVMPTSWSSTIGARVMTGDAGAIGRCRAGVAGGSGADGCPCGASARGWRAGGSSAWGSQGRLKVLFAAAQSCTGIATRRTPSAAQTRETVSKRGALSGRSAL